MTTLRSTLLLLSLVALAAPVHAQDDAAFDRAIDEALAEFQAGNWAEARTLFLDAHRIRPSAEALRMAGNASYEARDYVPAVKLLQRSLAETTSPLREDRRALAEEALAAARRFVTVVTVVAHEGATVRVDQRRVDVSEPLVLTRGQHVFEARATGFETRTDRLELTEPETTVRLNLVPPAEDQAPTEPDVIPERDETSPQAGGAKTWLWVTLGVAGAVLAGAVVATILLTRPDPPFGSNTPGEVVYALEFGQ